MYYKTDERLFTELEILFSSQKNIYVYIYIYSFLLKKSIVFIYHTFFFLGGGGIVGERRGTGGGGGIIHVRHNLRKEWDDDDIDIDI